MSKSKPQETTTATNTSTQIPDWLTNAAQQAVTTGQSLSQRPYDPYTGQIVATPGADINQSYQQVRDMQGQQTGAYDAAKGAYGNLIGQVNPITAGGVNDIASQLYGGYQQNVLNPAQGLLGQFAAGGPATAQQVGSNASALMSPYAQQVIDPTIAAGQQQLALANQKIAGQAANVGAFGGSRQGVNEGVASAQTALGTQQQIGQMLQTGWGQALTPASQLALQSGQQAYGASGLLANLAQTGYGNAATQAGNIANTNLSAGLTAASGLTGAATAEQLANQKDASLLQTIGAGQQNQQQQVDNAQMAQFYEQQGWPVQNLDLLLGTLGGVPYSTTGTGTNTSTANLNKNVAGGAVGGALSGAATGAAVSGGNPYVAAGGAVIGLLGSLG
jgi:hypothetical protein